MLSTARREDKGVADDNALPGKYAGHAARAADRLILSMADTGPPGMTLSRLERMARMARAFGPVIPKKSSTHH